MSRVQTVSFLVLCGALTLGSFAQAPVSPDNGSVAANAGSVQQDRVAKRLERMGQRLNLTTEQKEEIAPVLRDEAEQARAIRSDRSLTSEQRKGRLIQLHHSAQAQIESLLTPEQVAGMARLRARGTMARRGFRRISERLNLSEDQKSKIKPLLAEQHEKVLAVRSDSSLAAEQKRTRIREIRRSTHQQVAALLTPEQRQQLKEMRKHREGHGAESSEPSAAQPQR